MAVLYDEAGDEWEKQGKRTARLNTGIPGVHAVCPVQCERCWIRNLEGCDLDKVKHCQYEECIRRANLDAMNARARGTIEQHVSFIKNAVENAASINRTPFFKERGPFPLGDPVGMGLAVDLLLKSIFSKGQIKDYIQFDTMRKGRSTYTVTWGSSPAGIMDGACFNSTRSRIQFTYCPSESGWFKDFLLGAQDRMGYDTRKQLDLSILAIVAMIEQIESDIDTSEDVTQVNRLIKTAALVTILTAASLRGHEGFYLDIAGTQKYLHKGKHGQLPAGSLKKKIFTETEASNLPEVCICLVGKFKGETGERHHSIVLSNTTCSGLQPRKWIEKLLIVCQNEGRTSGSAFNESDGSPPISAEYNAIVRQYIQTMADAGEHGLDSDLDLIRYGISRTFRKSSETRARRAGIPKEQVETVNRWKKVERAQGRRPQFAMVDHYANARELSTLTWKYSYAL